MEKWSGRDERRGGMDEISVAIGELRAEAKAAVSQRTELFAQLGDVKEHIGDMKTMLTESNVKMTTMLENHDTKLDSHTADISALKSFRTKMYLGIAAISGTGGIAGALMTKMGLK
jgi:hypothetical protein